MEIATLVFTIIGAIGGIGSFGCFILALRDIQKVAGSLSNETLFGTEAKNRFKEITASLEKSQHWGPVPWEGGQDVHDMLEIKYVSYDPNSMGIEWKGCKQSVRRVYIDDTGKAKVEGWRIK